MVSACGADEPGGDAARFCGEVEANTDALTNPDLTSSDEIEPFLDMYRRIGELAPLAIEQEWDQITLNYETASTLVVGDDASAQRVLASAYRTERSAVAVRDWLTENCAVDIGPVATIVAPDT